MFKIQTSQISLTTLLCTQKILFLKYSQKPRNIYEYSKFSNFILPSISSKTSDHVQCQEFLYYNSSTEHITNYFNLDQIFKIFKDTILKRVEEDDQNPMMYQNSTAFKQIRKRKKKIKYNKVKHNLQLMIKQTAQNENKEGRNQEENCQISGSESSTVILEKITNDLSKMIKNLQKSRLEASLGQYLRELNVEQNQPKFQTIVTKSSPQNTICYVSGKNLQQINKIKLKHDMETQNEQQNYGLWRIKTKNQYKDSSPFQKQKTQTLKRNSCHRNTPVTPKPANPILTLWKRETSTTRKNKLQQTQNKFYAHNSKSRHKPSKSKKKLQKKIR